MNENILITGANGMVGGYCDFGVKLDHASLDVTNLARVLAVVRERKPKVILHLAALTDVDACERNPDQAYLVNSIGTYNMTVAAREVGAKLIYVSTAGVFDGTKTAPYDESDKPNPQNMYGHSKYLGELAVTGNLTDYIIVRVCWMMGGGPARDKKFVAKIIRQLDNSETKEIKAVNDQIGSPTFAKDLIAAIKTLIEKNEKGIFHLSGSGVASRYDVAELMVKTLKKNIAVVPVDSAFFKLDAMRPRNESMNSRVPLMRPWQEALEDYLNTEWKK